MIFTQSKAFWRSQNIPPTRFFSKDSWILFNKAYVAISVVDFSLKPNCSFVSILFLIRKQFNPLYITFSIIFEKEDKNEIGR